MRRLMLTRMPITALVAGALLAGAACSTGSDEVADDQDTGAAASASPTAAGGVPEDVESVEIAIADGEFSDDQIEFQQDTPSILVVTNEDDQRYTLEIGDLVAGWQLVPSDTTTVEFTTPKANEYEAQLIPEAGGEALDTMTVVVEAPGATDGQP